jgi:hypothetical protein
MSLDVRGEVIKLARELDVAAAELDFLEQASRDDVHRLRVGIEEALDRRHRPFYRRLEASSRLLPPSVALKIARMSFTPLVVARISEDIPPDRGIKMTEQTPIDYMGELLLYMNPQRMVESVRTMPLRLMKPMIAELARREEFITLGRYLGVLASEQIPDVVAEIQDGRTLLLCGFHDEDPSNLDEVVAAMSDEQVASILQAVLGHDLAPELAAVADHVGDGATQRFRDAVAAMPADQQEALRSKLAPHDLDW